MARRTVISQSEHDTLAEAMMILERHHAPGRVTLLAFLHTATVVGDEAFGAPDAL